MPFQSVFQLIDTAYLTIQSHHAYSSTYMAMVCNGYLFLDCDMLSAKGKG